MNLKNFTKEKEQGDRIQTSHPEKTQSPGTVSCTGFSLELMAGSPPLAS